MTDLKMTKLCADAMGYRWYEPGLNPYGDPGQKPCIIMGEWGNEYDPLNKDAQAMALDTYIIKAGYCISYERDECEIYPIEGQSEESHRPMFHWALDMTKPENRRRVRVECVAKLQK